MLNKNFHHIVLLPLSAFMVSFLASLFIIPGPRANNKNDIAPPPCATFHNEHCDGKCEVCFENIASKHYVLPCGHKFCKGCIDNWAKECNRETTEDVQVEVTFPVNDIQGNPQNAVPGAQYIEKRKEYSSNNMVYVYEVTDQKITKHSHQPCCPLCCTEFSLPNKSLFSTIFGFNIF